VKERSESEFDLPSNAFLLHPFLNVALHLIHFQIFQHLCRRGESNPISTTLTNIFSETDIEKQKKINEMQEDQVKKVLAQVRANFPHLVSNRCSAQSSRLLGQPTPTRGSFLIFI
jgi:hypothetical protein